MWDSIKSMVKQSLSSVWQVLKKEIGGNWIKIVCIIIACVYLYSTIDHVKAWLTRSTEPQVITNTTTERYITPSGNITTTAPPMVVTVPQVIKEVTTVGVEKKADPKTSADVVLNEQNSKYLFEYKNGLGSKTFELTPDIQEDYKFQNGQMVINRTITNKTSVSVPTPSGGVGIGASLEGKPAVSWSARIGKTSANLEVVTNGHKEGTFFLINNAIYK